MALFVEKGFAATRAEEIAKRAGVSKGTLYLYYPSKEELLKAVIEQRLSTEIAAGAQAVASHEGSCADLLTEVLAAWWERVVESDASGVFKLIITEVRNFPDIAAFYVQQVVEPGSRIIGQILEMGIERGEFRRVDIESTVHSLVLPMVMLCIHRHSMGACCPSTALDNPAAFIRQHMSLVMHGLHAPDVASVPRLA